MGKEDKEVGDPVDSADPARRQVAISLFSVLGGAALLEGCAPSRRSDSVEEIVQGASGMSSLVWVDTVLARPILPLPPPPTSPPARSAGDLATRTSTQLGGTVVIAKGCLTPGDGGGGVFFWDTSGTDDGGTIIVPNANVGAPGTGGCWKRVTGAGRNGALNIRWFGAGGDGSNDDSAAIQFALDAVKNAGGAVYIPPGSHLIKSTNPNAGLAAVTVNGSNIRIFGDGTSSEILVDEPGVPSACGSPKIQRYDAIRLGGNNAFITFENFQMRGRNDPFLGVCSYNGLNGETQQAAIAVRGDPAGCHDVIIRNLTFKNLFSHVVRSPHGGEHHWYAINCHVYQCTNGMNINADYVVHEGGSVIQANGIETIGNYTKIIGVTVSDGTGINVGGNGQVLKPQVIGCNLRNITVGGAGIAVVGCINAVIADNTVESVGSGMLGILIDDCQTGQGGPSGPVIIKGNVVDTRPSGHHACWFHGSAGGSVIHGNQFTGYRGLVVQCNDVTASGNILSGTNLDMSLEPTGGAGPERMRFMRDNVLLSNSFYKGVATTGYFELIGTAAPSAGLDVPNGSIYVRTGGASPNLYVRENGAWVSK
jgi:hypothetical protein